MDNLDHLILLQLHHFIRDASSFTTDLLSNEITKDEQISFAHRLVDLAEAIKERTESATGQVIAGSVSDDSADHDTSTSSPST